MEEQTKFYIDNNGQQIPATIITNFEIYGDNYCIYTIPKTGTKDHNIYCAKIIGSNLVKIENEKERNMVSKIVQKILGL